MGRNIQDIIDGLPPARRKRVDARARVLADEMIREADSLRAMRKATGRTQAELAQVLGVTQHAISQIENRTEVYVSTLQRYVEALGYKLEVTLVTPQNRRVALQSFRPWARAERVEAASRTPRARRPSESK